MDKDFHLLARDVYPEWALKIASASESITVFTPYFDKLLVELVAKAVLKVPVTVVTDLSPTGGQDYLGQLRASLDLLRMGVELRNLPRLHAKILIVDQTSGSIGSQNFTSFARLSSESTVVFSEEGMDEEFFKTLKYWKDSSFPVDFDLIYELLETIEPSTRPLFELEQQTKRAYEQLMEECKTNSVANIREVIEEAIARSSTRFAEGPATGRVQSAEDSLSFLVTNGRDLTTWISHGKQSTLPRLTMLPLLFAETGKLSFVRVGKTRISYLRDAVMMNKSFDLDGESLKWRVSFPDVDLRSDDSNYENIYIELYLNSSSNLKELVALVSFQFTGVHLSLCEVSTDDSSMPNSVKADYASRLTRHFSSSESCLLLGNMIFKSFRFQRLGVDQRNAHTSFGFGFHQIDILEFSSRPILVATRISD